MKPTLLGLLLCGCITTRVSERYVLQGDGPTIQHAAEQATQRLGWPTEAIDGGKFKLVDYPNRPRPTLTISAQDQLLTVEADVPIGQQYLPGSARILRSATEEILSGRPQGVRVTERSRAITAALDVLSPGMGSLYALQGDPAFDSDAVQWDRTYWAETANRFFVDATAGVAMGYFASQRSNGFAFTVGIIAVDIGLLVLSRVVALVRDMSSVSYRNAYARSGLSVPEEH